MFTKAGYKATAWLPLMIIALIVAVFPLVMMGCAAGTAPVNTQYVWLTHVCILAQCESDTEADRIGDPSSGGGDVNEAVDENISSVKGQKGKLDLSLDYWVGQK